jgi:hypothetical protein
MNLRKTLISSAVVTSFGAGSLAMSSAASAEVIQLSWTGAFTLLDATGGPFNNSSLTVVDDGWYGWRTAISGTLTMDTSTGAGSATMNPFSLGANGNLVATSISLQAIGDGMGNPGTLMLGNMSFNWAGNNGIPMSIVWDAYGLISTLSSGTCGPVCAITGGVAPASNNTVFGTGRFTYTSPLGNAPMATTTWNTTDIGIVTLGTNPSGTLPLIADTVANTKCDITVAPFNCTGIGSSPMKAGPFNSWNMNFDILSMQTFIVIPSVPLPPAVWLFGSGLLGLASVMRRKRRGVSEH